MARKKRPKYRRRLVQYSYESLRYRLRYLCDFLFSGDDHAMAFALDMNHRDLYLVLTGGARATARLLAHITAKFNVSAEWLLCGTGAFYATTAPEEPFQLPLKLASEFGIFDTLDSAAGATLPAPIKKVSHGKKSQDIRHYLSAGQAVYLARANHKLIGFFLGHAAFTSGVAELVPQFYSAGFGSLLCLTLSAAAFDMAAACTLAAVDINDIARLAAARGIGYGAALSLAASPSVCSAAKSVLMSVAAQQLPVVVTAEVGELAAHTAPSLRGAEVGAAIGAAAYVDLLVLTAQLKEFFASPGGVFIVAGDHVRGVRLLLQRIESLRALYPRPSGFTFVVFAPHDTFLETYIHEHGGHVIFLDHPTTAAMTQLFQSCNDVYAGKTLHEHQ